MEEKDTSDLREELMAEPNLEAYLKDNEDAFIGGSIAEDLNAFLVDRAISKLDLARRASMSEIYVRQIFSGRRFPSRDRIPMRQPPYWFHPAASTMPPSTATTGVPTGAIRSLPRCFLR